MTAKRVIFVASVAEMDARAVLWRELFGMPRVAIISNELSAVIFPNGVSKACYLLDFSMKPAEGPDYHQRLRECFSRRGGDPAMQAMINSGIYPIVAEGVTVTEAGFFCTMQQAGGGE